jgi:hypothetical protein
LKIVETTPAVSGRRNCQMHADQPVKNSYRTRPPSIF